MDELHFNYRLSCWARRTRTSTIDYSDPFVVENRDRCRFLRRYLRDYQRQNVTLRDVIEQETDVDESVFYSEINVCYENWTKDVCRWWNKMMVYCRRRGRRPDGVDVDHSNRCLYLYGSTAAGKSTYVETILSAAGSRRSHNPLRHVYYPGVGRYFMRHFDVDFHRAIVFEEFDVGQYNVAMLKRLCAKAVMRGTELFVSRVSYAGSNDEVLRADYIRIVKRLCEGRNYSYPVSRTRDRTMTFCGPIIFVSPDDTYIRSAAGYKKCRR
ncbi:hypothetical protein QE152_g33891 [Popillia japonica]|uniref:Uncharacterized protein n=1 Tax=Popillia japonica TaxID=7064 RepID=A0AAW1IVI1_POPJA